MKDGIGNHIRTHVVGYVAVFLALSGTAAALPGHDTVFSDDIVARGVRSTDIDTGAVRPSDLAHDAVSTGKLANGQVRSPDIGAGAVGASEIGDGQVAGADVRDDGLTGADVDESTLGPVPSADNVLSARVTNGAVLLGGVGAEGASKSTPGNYQVDFDRPIVGACAATVSLSDAISGEATVSVPSEVFDASVINVRTSSSAGVPSDRSFDVTVVC